MLKNWLKSWVVLDILSRHCLLCFLNFGYSTLLISYHTCLLSFSIVSINIQAALSRLLLAFYNPIELVVGWNVSFKALIILDGVLQYFFIIFSFMFIRIFIITAQLFLDRRFLYLLVALFLGLLASLRAVAVVLRFCEGFVCSWYSLYMV